MNATTYAVDMAKSVMQLHWVELETGEIHRKKLSRGKFSSSLLRCNRRAWPWRPAVVLTTGRGH